MHPTKVLSEQVLAIEVIEHWLINTWGRRAHVASPES
jgi:hypothetical protein